MSTIRMSVVRVVWFTYILSLHVPHAIGYTYEQDLGITGVTCPTASLDFGLTESSMRCARRCSMIANTCQGFFYSKSDGECLGTPSIIGSLTDCVSKTDTVYYKTTAPTTASGAAPTTATEAAPTTATAAAPTTATGAAPTTAAGAAPTTATGAAPTTATTLPPTTTTTTLPPGVFGSSCVTDAECTNTFSTCLQGSCSCQLNFRLESASGSCVETCTTYGSTYIKYPNMMVYGGTPDTFTATVAECGNLCASNSSCRGFRTYDDLDCTLLDDPDFSYETVNYHYYSRNCAQ